MGKWIDSRSITTCMGCGMVFTVFLRKVSLWTPQLKEANVDSGTITLPYKGIQWNPALVDTNGTYRIVPYSKVSQGLLI